MVAFTLVSYNVSFAEPSSAAPDRALRAQEAPRLLRDEILRCSPSRPDVIALQECPRESWGTALFGPDYVSMGTRPASHVPEGHVDLLVRRELTSDARRIDLDHPAFVLPSVAAAIAPSDGTPVAVCSLHLPHTAEGAALREMMCEATMQIISQKFSNCILIGDLNMRDKEDEVVESLDGGGWTDVWKRSTGQNKKSKYTWDSRENRFHENGFAFACRFDRCLARGRALTPTRFDLIGNRPVNGRKGDYLSDHYGIAVKVDVLQPPSPPGNSMNRSQIKGKGLVDLTGDSDNEDGDMNVHSSSRKGGDRKTGDIGDRAKRKDGQISLEEMRRLRLQKVSGSKEKSIGEQSVSKVNEKVRPSNTLSAGMLFDSASGQAYGILDGDQSNSNAGPSGDIHPVKPTKFTDAESEKPKRYIIYMAIRERKDSSFARGLAKCDAACHESIRHCLQMDGTRHITMFDGKLTTHQVKNLAVGGQFCPIEIKIDGWKRWDAGCYLQLNKSSEHALRDLLARIDWLPPTGGTRSCDHISLYRKRANTHHSDLKREFHKIREATKFHDWGCVEGVGVRIKAFGGPYDECRVLVEARPGSRNGGIRKDGRPTGWNNLRDTGLNPKHSLRGDQWNDGYDSDVGRSSAAHERSGFRDYSIDCDSGADQSSLTHETVTFRHHSTSDSNISLIILSWNISETSMNPISAAAPDSYLRARESARLVREECLRPHLALQLQNGNAFLPDIIALQETPDDGWGSAVFGPSGYVSVGVQRSHCGLVDLLVRKDFAPQRMSLLGHGGYCEEGKRGNFAFNDDCQSELPSVCAIITLPNGTVVGVASNHLAPHASGASARAQQFKLLMELVMKKCQNAILIGDMNMRKAEDKVIESLVGGGWIDAWKDGSGSSKQMCFTWNSFENRYHENGFNFKCRFDRCYAKGENLSVEKFALIGNRPVSSTKGDYLSDHYGIAVAVTIGLPLENIDKGSKETPRRGNGKMSTRSTKSTLAKSDPFADKKMESSKAAKKRSRFESSSSEDDDEEIFRVLARKQGRVYKPREDAVAATSKHAKMGSSDTEPSQGSKGAWTAPPNTARKKGRFASSSSDDDKETLHMLARQRGQECRWKRRKLLHDS